jgi:hypothetical protein
MWDQVHDRCGYVSYCFPSFGSDSLDDETEGTKGFTNDHEHHHDHEHFLDHHRPILPFNPDLLGDESEGSLFVFGDEHHHYQPPTVQQTPIVNSDPAFKSAWTLVSSTTHFIHVTASKCNSLINSF